MTKPLFVPQSITVHCSATKNGERVDISVIRQWHLAKGWKDVGYHMVIQPDGEVQNGRPLNQIGAHVEGANDNNIGICMIGLDKFSEAQFKSLREKLDSLHMVYNIEPWDITCHYEYPSAQAQGKTCPNMNIRRLLIWYVHQDNLAIKPYMVK